MFDDQQKDEEHSTNNDGTGGISAPTLGLGANPSRPTTLENTPASSGAPTVVLPTVPASDDDDSVNSTVSPTTGDTPTTSVAQGDLTEIKRLALEQLSPLVGKLDQTPEEKYKTLMMMIQASDNHELINEAYEYAQKISDEKVKAEALLNIVNEINYFTQKAQS
ncbi:MAG: hypothetical protein ACR2FM_05670 [Candidatus Saccharimonadales bacterium]